MCALFSVDGDLFPKGEIVSAIRTDNELSHSLVHSFGMTENYYVIVQQPLLFSLSSFIATHIRGKGSVCNSLKWRNHIKVFLHFGRFTLGFTLSIFELYNVNN